MYSEEYTCNSGTPIKRSVGGVIATPRPEEKIHHIEQQPESLHGCHICTLVLYNVYTVKHHRRARHREHGAHEAAQRAHRRLRPTGVEKHSRPTLKENKIERYKHQSHSKTTPQDNAIDSTHIYYDKIGNKNIEQEHNRNRPPLDITPIAHHNKQRSASRENARKRHSLIIRGHDIRQEHHYEYPEAEPRHTLHKTRTCRQAKEYQKNLCHCQGIAISCAKLTKKIVTRKELPLKSQRYYGNHSCGESTITPSAFTGLDASSLPKVHIFTLFPALCNRSTRPSRAKHLWTLNEET